MPDIYQTDNLDEAIDIVQDLTKVNERKGKIPIEYYFFSDIHLFSDNLTLEHVERNGRVIISRKRSVQNQ